MSWQTITNRAPRVRAHHHAARPITGGSREYVRRIAERLGPDAISLGDPVRAVVRDQDGVLVLPTRGAAERFDAIVMATHADTALRGQRQQAMRAG